MNRPWPRPAYCTRAPPFLRRRPRTARRGRPRAGRAAHVLKLSLRCAVVQHLEDRGEGRRVPGDRKGAALLDDPPHPLPRVPINHLVDPRQPMQQLVGVLVLRLGLPAQLQGAHVRVQQ